MEIIIGLSIAALIGFITYGDAKKRGMNAKTWGVLTFASMFPVLIIYFIIRKDKMA